MQVWHCGCRQSAQNFKQTNSTLEILDNILMHLGRSVLGQMTIKCLH